MCIQKWLQSKNQIFFYILFSITFVVIFFFLLLLLFVCFSTFIYRYPNVDLTFEAVKRTLQRIRNKQSYKSPKTIDEINECFQDEYVIDEYSISMFKPEEKKLIFKHAFECKDYSYCIFASDAIINMMTEHIPENTRILYLDATFKVVPLGDFSFKQLLIIHIDYLDKVSILKFVYFMTL